VGSSSFDSGHSGDSTSGSPRLGGVAVTSVLLDALGLHLGQASILVLELDQVPSNRGVEYIGQVCCRFLLTS